MKPKNPLSSRRPLSLNRGKDQLTVRSRLPLSRPPSDEDASADQRDASSAPLESTKDAPSDELSAPVSTPLSTPLSSGAHQEPSLTEPHVEPVAPHSAPMIDSIQRSLPLKAKEISEGDTQRLEVVSHLGSEESSGANLEASGDASRTSDHLSEPPALDASSGPRLTEGHLLSPPVASHLEKSDEGSHIDSFSSVPSVLFAILGCAALFTLTHLLWSSSALGDLLLGGNTAHFMSQLCTMTIFLWGMSELSRHAIQLRRERQLIKMYSAGETLSDAPLSRVFLQEVKRGVSSSDHYLEARDLVTAAREGVHDRLSSRERGAQTAMWLLPLSGFLGTVLGMSATIARFNELFTPAEGGKLLGLSELAPAIQGLGTAFDTTLLALALVIPLKLLLTFTQSASERFVHALEARVGAPLLESFAAQERPRGQSDQARESGELSQTLAQLKDQSHELRLALHEMASSLQRFGEQVSQNPALSDQAHKTLGERVERAAYQGADRARHDGEAQRGGLEQMIAQVAERQDATHRQLGEVQRALNAPLVIQRAPQGSGQGDQ